MGLESSRVLAWQVLGMFEGASLAGAWKVCVVVGCECACMGEETGADVRGRITETPLNQRWWDAYLRAVRPNLKPYQRAVDSARRSSCWRGEESARVGRRSSGRQKRGTSGCGGAVK